MFPSGFCLSRLHSSSELMQYAVMSTKMGTNNNSGNSLWQQQLPAAGTTDPRRFTASALVGSTDEQTWRMAASRLALDNQLWKRSSSRQDNNNNNNGGIGGVDHHHHHHHLHARKISFADMLLNNSEVLNDPPCNSYNIPPPLCKPAVTFYSQQQQQCSQGGGGVGQTEKWYKTLPPAEMLPRNEVLGGYIFVCNNETMQEDLRRQLFGLPQKYKDSVRAITPGLPLFLYNYTAHQLHGVFQAVSFGGSNIDPTAWEDKKCRGESRFPAQVRIRVKKKCKPLEEDSFRPVLFHYDGPKFRLQLSVPEALALLDLFTEDDI